MSAVVHKFVQSPTRGPAVPSRSARFPIAGLGNSQSVGPDLPISPVPLALYPAGAPGRCWGQPTTLVPIFNRKSWQLRIVEDIACATIVLAASLAGLVALGVGIWPGFISSQSAAFTFFSVLALGVGLAAAGRRSLAARCYTAIQSALRPALVAGAVATVVTVCSCALLGLPLSAAVVLAAGFVVGAAVSGFLAGRVLRSQLVSKRLRRNVAIYGASAEARTIFDAIASDESASYAGLFEERATTDRIEMVGLPINGRLRELEKKIAAGTIDNVVIALPIGARDRSRAIADRLLELPVDVAITPALSSAIPDVRGIATIELSGRSLTLIHCSPITGWGAIAKIGIDRGVAAVALFALSPLLVLIALAIKFESRGPVFFRQRRHGICGRPIVVWKFRTMGVMEDGAVVRQASKNDDRVTRVGRLLRRTSLDELPQLINVLEGSMSLVGPRPHAIAHDEHYGALIPTYTRRSMVRPGITGWAQINGLRGETRTNDDMVARVKHDLWYVSNWSLALDIKIILLTPIFGLINKNAY